MFLLPPFVDTISKAGAGDCGLNEKNIRTDWKIGDRVSHETLGPGSVIAIIELNRTRLFQIEFDLFGVRLMDPQYANLQQGDYFHKETPEVDEGWKSALSPLLFEITQCEVSAHSHSDAGKALNRNAISSVVTVDSDTNSLNSALNGKYGDLLKQLRSRLPSGYVAFIGVVSWFILADFRTLASPTFPLEFVIAPGDSQFDILRCAHTKSRNTKQSTDDMIRTLKKFDDELGIDILQAATDSILIALLRLPPDPMVFAKALFEFCPNLDTLYSADSLAEHLKNPGLLHLWWD